MTVRPVVIALCTAVVVGCIQAHYPCQTDGDCNVGSNGRCEANHECTVFDPTCPLERRYTEYSGSDSNVCFDDAVAPLNECAGGQPPAPTNTTDACAQTVCQHYLPSCCTSAWSDACVQEAQVHCGLKCNFDIALIAQSGSSVLGTVNDVYELWDLRFDGATNTMQERLDDTIPTRSRFLSWLAPAPGDIAPRLASLDGSGNLLVGDGSNVSTIDLTPGFDYNGIASIDFDRDGNDTAVLTGSGGSSTGPNMEVLKLATGSSRALANTVPMALQSWGDPDGTPFPGAAVASGNSDSYRILYNVVETPSDDEGVDDSELVNYQGGNAPDNRGFAWGDLNHDMRMDLVAFGAATQIQLGMEPSRLSTSVLRIDCNTPTSKIGSGSGCTNPDTVGFAGAIEVQAADSDVIASVIDTTPGTGTGSATEPNHVDTMFRFNFVDGVFDNNPISIGFTGAMCPASCAVQTVVSRDFDGDGIMDIFAVDSSMNVWMGLSKAQTPPGPPTTLVFQFQLAVAGGSDGEVTPPVEVIHASVSGTPAP